MSVLLKKKWTILEEVDNDRVRKFSELTNIPYSLSKVLIHRGINSKAEAKKFFVPELDQLHDPFLMKDMDKASERIADVIKNREKILVFGDYDVDGTSGVSMFHTFLKELGVDNAVYIPDRFTDGYGLSNTGIDHAGQENIKLIVAIDCGITAFDKVEYARTKGIEIIICDHHQPPEQLPNAFAVLDALQNDCNYPFKSLCGTGVAFKLIQAVCMKMGLDAYHGLLDFVAVATAADMVPVTGENRVLLHFGFKQIKENPRPSFLTLIRNSGFRLEDLNTSNVVFSLGPRINAVGRLGDATRAVEFLTCDDASKVGALAGILESENTNRKKIDSEIFLQAQASYEEQKNKLSDEEDVAIILHNPDWHPGVLGIIASRMVEKYYRPSIILTTFNGYAKGSARSVSNFNIYEALKQCSEEYSGIVQFGGHYHAAGLEVELDMIEKFRSTFNQVARKIISNTEDSGEIMRPEIKIETELNTREISPRFVKILRHFEPFGPGNMMPVFLSRNMEVVGEPKVYNQSTYVFKVRKLAGDVPAEQHAFECIYYRHPSVDESERFLINRGDILDIVYSVDENHWNGITKTQLRIRDLKTAEE